MVKITNPQEYFYASNGAVLKDLTELVSYLRTVDEGSFSHHVTAEKNDFANWIQGVLQNKTLAKKISKLRTSQGLLAVIEAAINQNSKQNKKKQTIIAKIKEAFV